MGVLEDLLKQMQEAAEQGQRTTLPGAPRPAAAPVPLPAAPARQPARAAPTNFAKRARQPEPVQLAPDAHRSHDGDGGKGEDPVHRLVADSAPAFVVKRKEHPLFARLRDAKGLRDAVILSEILRRPSRRR